MNILMSAYGIDPFGVSEHYAAFNWLRILLKEHQIMLVTTKEAEISLLKFYKGQLPENLKIIGFKDNIKLRYNRILRPLILSYFLFNHRVFRYFKKHVNMLEPVDLIFHKSPSSFRYYSSLCRFNKPFVFGPTGGGLKTPKELKKYFAKEDFLFRLRNFDSFLLKLPPYKRQLKKAKNILTTLGYVRDVFPKEYHHKIVELFDTGIDCSAFKRQLPYTKKDFVNLLYVGKLRRYKGPELLIRAFSQLNFNLLPPVKLYIIGDGEEEFSLKALVQKLNLTDHIIFCGHQPIHIIKQYYENADIFCFPTLKEASGNVLLEAMCYELPIITINNGGPKYMCPDNGTIKIDICDEKLLIEKIKNSINELVTDFEKRKTMGKFNLEHCLHNYDWNILEKKILAFFNSL